MDENNLFNKERFAELLNKAKGDRSINKYAEETDVSAAHISRFLRNMIDAPPTPETISKFSSKAYNEVSYRDLMVAAGHISIREQSDSGDDENEEIIERNTIIERTSPNERRMEIMNIEKRLFQIILSHLYEVPFEWNMQKPDVRMRFPDMIIDIDDGDYKRWLIEFKAYPESYLSMGLPPNQIYGMLATTDLAPTDKFSIVVNNENAYNMFFRRPPVSLRANVYLMLVDIKKGKIIKEEMLCSYDPI